MTPEMWKKVSEAWEAYFNLSADNRDGYLQKLRGDDAELAAELETLLRQGQKSGQSKLSAPPSLVLAQAASLKRETVAHQPASEDISTVNPDAHSSVDAGRRKQKPPTAADLPDIAGYEIQGVLGRGGMGVVYKAKHLQLNRTVALKMILSGGHAGEEDVKRFLSEAEAVAAFQHHNIVQVFEVGRHNNLPYMALEFVEGGSLADRLKDGALPPNEAARLVEQMAHGMNAAHQAGIVHRDLKPANVLLSVPTGGSPVEQKNDKRAARHHDSVPKITDFGLAKKVEGGAELTASGAIMGTPSYMAPEQASGEGKRVGPSADVYALGAILYACLTGRPPFQAENMMDLLLKVVSREPTPPRRFNDSVPSDLQIICLKCLEKDASRRYASAHDLAEDLRCWQAGEPITARPVGRGERVIKWVRRRPVVAALSGLAMLSLVLGAAISTAFGIVAQRNATTAAEKTTLANKKSELAKEKEELAKKRLREFEVIYAKGLIRSLGQTSGNKPSPLEMDTLWEIATLPNDKIRVLFLKKALESEQTAFRINRTANFATHAAVGLDPSKRKEVIAHIVSKIRDKNTPELTREACVRIGEALEFDNTEFAELVTNWLMDLTLNDDSKGRPSFLDRYAKCVTQKSAEIWAGKLCEKISISENESALRNTVASLKSSLERSNKEKARTLSKQLVGNINSQFNDPNKKELREHYLLALATASEFLDSKKDRKLFKKIATIFVDTMTEKSGFIHFRYLSGFPERLIGLMAKLDDKDAIKIIRDAFQKLNPESKEFELYSDSRWRFITRLATGTEDEQISKTITTILTRETQSFASLEFDEATKKPLQKILDKRKNNQSKLPPFLQFFADMDPAYSQRIHFHRNMRSLITVNRFSKHDSKRIVLTVTNCLEKSDDPDVIANLAYLSVLTSGRIEKDDSRDLTYATAKALLPHLGKPPNNTESDTFFGLDPRNGIRLPDGSLAELSPFTAFQLVVQKIDGRDLVKVVNNLADAIVKSNERSALHKLCMGLRLAMARMPKSQSSIVAANVASVQMTKINMAKTSTQFANAVATLNSIVENLDKETATEIAVGVKDYIAKSPDPNVVAHLSEPLVKVLRLSDKKDSKRIAAVVGNKLLRETTAGWVERFALPLSVTFERIESHLDKNARQDIAARIAVPAIQIVSRSEKVSVIADGMQIFGNVYHNLSEEQKRKVTTTVAEILPHAIGNSSNDSEQVGLLQSSWRICSMVQKKDAVHIASKVVKRLKDTKNAYVRWSGIEFLHLVQPASANEDIDSFVLSSIATSIKPIAAGQIGRTYDPATARALNIALEKAIKLLSRIKMEDYGQQLIELVRIDELNSKNISLNYDMLGMMLAGDNSEDFTGESAFIKLSKSLSKKQILSLLKCPTCIGLPRKLLVSEYGRRCGQSFDNHWKLVDWVQQNEPQMDLASLPKRTSVSTYFSTIRMSEPPGPGRLLGDDKTSKQPEGFQNWFK